MDQAGAVFMVRFWVKPDALDTVLDWLDGGHISEVVEGQGFLWAKRVRLVNDDAADDGWPAFAMIYGVTSLDDLLSYFESGAPGRFAAERAEKGLDDLMRVENDWGVVEYTAVADPAGP